MMQINRKLVLNVMVGLVLLSFVSWWFWWPIEEVAQEELISKIQNGYTQQFCGVVMPRIADCVTFNVNQCPDIVKDQLRPCINELQDGMPLQIEKDEAKKLYQEVAGCFEGNMHDIIMKEYLVNTEQCKQRLA